MYLYCLTSYAALLTPHHADLLAICAYFDSVGITYDRLPQTVNVTMNPKQNAHFTMADIALPSGGNTISLGNKVTTPTGTYMDL